MRLTRVLLATSAMLAIALVPTVPASAADQITWPEVQAAAQAAQTILMQGGGTVTDEVSAKISYRQVTQYQPGGAVMLARYREAGMADSEPDEVTWTITRKGVETRYRAMPSLPRAGRYPTLRSASWVRLTPLALTGSTPVVLHLLMFDPMGEISSGPPNDAGVISASWTHGIDGTPDSAITATFTRTADGGLVLRSVAKTDLLPNGPGSDWTVQVDFGNPMLTVPNFRSALPEAYVDAAMDAARSTTSAFYSVRNAARNAREKAGTMSRPRLIGYVRSEVAVWEDFSHPPADPSPDILVNIPGGLRLTNPNPYSGQSTTWTISVTMDKQVVVTRRTRPSMVIPVP